MKIGIFGGTFDPFSPGHKAIVEESLSKLDTIIIVPTIVNWHRSDKKTWLLNSQKIELIKSVFDNIDVLGYQLIRRYDVEQTLKNYRVILDISELQWAKNNPDLTNDRRYVHILSDITCRYGIEHDYYTIIGTDSYKNLGTWWKTDAIQDLAKLIVFNGRNNENVSNITYSKTNNTEFIQIPTEFSDISASKIRETYSKITNGYNQYISDFKEGNIK